jgi:hypothetical protein
MAGDSEDLLFQKDLFKGGSACSKTAIMVDINHLQTGKTRMPDNIIL